MCKSSFRDDWGGLLPTILNWIAWPAEFGSRSILYAATQPTKSGAYISSCEETPPSTFVVSGQGKEMQEKFWKECTALWTKLDPQVAKAWE